MSLACYEAPDLGMGSPFLANSTKDNFGRNLELWFFIRGIKSQTEVAKPLGVTRSMISSWLNGVHLPRAEQLDRLGVLLDIPVAWLFVDRADPRTWKSSALKSIMLTAGTAMYDRNPAILRTYDAFDATRMKAKETIQGFVRRTLERTDLDSDLAEALANRLLSRTEKT